MTGFPVTFVLSAGNTHGSPKFPNYPFEYMPCSQTPVETLLLAISLQGLLPSAHSTASAFALALRAYPMSTTIPFSGLNRTACILTLSGFGLPLPGLPSDFAADLLAKL
jgi:hypothetical protein